MLTINNCTHTLSSSTNVVLSQFEYTGDEDLRTFVINEEDRIYSINEDINSSKSDHL